MMCYLHKQNFLSKPIIINLQLIEEFGHVSVIISMGTNSRTIHIKITFDLFVHFLTEIICKYRTTQFLYLL
jgi:hypothetical protein